MPFKLQQKKRYVLLGLGPAKKDMADGSAVKLGSTLASTCNAEKKVKSCSIFLPTAFTETVSESKTLISISSQFCSALYSDNRYRTGDNIKKSVPDLTSVTFVSESPTPETLSSQVEEGTKIAKGLYLAKDIVNAPHNVLNSESLANVARKIASDSNGTIKCTILGKEECEKRGMGAYLGVARGSETDPQFIHLTYTGKGDIK